MTKQEIYKEMGDLAELMEAEDEKYAREYRERYKELKEMLKKLEKAKNV